MKTLIGMTIFFWSIVAFGGDSYVYCSVNVDGDEREDESYYIDFDDPETLELSLTSEALNEQVQIEFNLITPDDEIRISRFDVTFKHRIYDASRTETVQVAFDYYEPVVIAKTEVYGLTETIECYITD